MTSPQPVATENDASRSKRAYVPTYKARGLERHECQRIASVDIEAITGRSRWWVWKIRQDPNFPPKGRDGKFDREAVLRFLAGGEE